MTKDQLVEMLASDSDIANYVKFKADFGTGNLYPISQENVLQIFVRCIDAYEKIIQTVLADLDETPVPLNG